MTAYVLAFRGAFLRQMRMRGALLFTTVFYCIILVCWGAIWWAAIGGSGGEIHGYTYAHMFWYIAGTEAAVVVASSRRIERIGEENTAGLIEVEMLRPASVVGIRLALELGESLARLVFVGTAAFVMGVLYTHEVPTLGALALALPSMILAVACNNAALYAFACISFWLRDAKAAWFLFQKCIFLPGGMLLPVQLMPHAMAVVIWYLPFWTMAYAPGRLLSGFSEPLLLAGQLVWCVGLYAIACGVFSLGERRVQQGLV